MKNLVAVILVFTFAAGAQAQNCTHPITCNSTVTASLSFASCLDAGAITYDVYTIQAAGGSRLDVNVQSAFFAPALRIINPSSAQVAGDSNPGNTPLAAVSYSVPTAGIYSIMVRNTSISGDAQYTLSLSCLAANEPPPTPKGFVVSVTPQSLTMERGQHRTMHVTSTPIAPYSWDVFVSIVNLPFDVTATPLTFSFPGGLGAADFDLAIGPAAAGGTFFATANGTGSDGTVSIAAATLFVDAVCVPPRIATQTRSISISRGHRAGLHVTAQGSPAFTYQWYHGPSGSTYGPDPAGLSPDYLTPAITGDDQFWVGISNSCGSTASGTVNVHATDQPSRGRAARH